MKIIVAKMEWLVPEHKGHTFYSAHSVGEDGRIVDDRPQDWANKNLVRVLGAAEVEVTDGEGLDLLKLNV